jgi:hypothetical protein
MSKNRKNLMSRLKKSLKMTSLNRRKPIRILGRSSLRRLVLLDNLDSHVIVLSKRRSNLPPKNRKLREDILKPPDSRRLTSLLKLLLQKS